MDAAGRPGRQRVRRLVRRRAEGTDALDPTFATPSRRTVSTRHAHEPIVTRRPEDSGTPSPPTSARALLLQRSATEMSARASSGSAQVSQARDRRCADTKANTPAGTTSPAPRPRRRRRSSGRARGPHSVRPGACRHESQEVVDQRVVKAITGLAAALIDDALERRTPLHEILLGLGKPREVPRAQCPGGGSPV